MNVMPFGEKELNEYLERFEDGICYELALYFRLINPADPHVDEEGNELSEEEIKDVREELEKSLGIEYYESATIINVIRFIFCDEGAFRYEGFESSGIIKIIDVNGDSGLLSLKKITNQATKARNDDNK